MGQKLGKQADEAAAKTTSSSNSSDIIIKEITVNHNLILPKASCSSSGSSAASTTSSKSKSNHYSAISNDSGCYTDRYSSQSGSSLLYLYDLSSKEEVAAKLQSKASYRSANPSTSLNTTCTQKSKTLTSKCSARIAAANIRTLKNLQTMHRNSLCDSIILSCSSSSSNSCINTCGVDSKPAVSTRIGMHNEDDLLNDSDLDSANFMNKNSEFNSKRAQILCDQLNKILNISAILVNEETSNNNNNSTVNKRDTSIDTTKLASKSVRQSKQMKLKTMNGTVKSPHTSKLESSSKNKTISRSYTFSNNVKDMEKRNNCTANVLKNFLDNGSSENIPNGGEAAVNKTITSAQKSSDPVNKSSSKFSNMLLKNGRRILSTLNSSSRKGVYGKSQAGLANGENKSALKKEETLINLIAAKLMSENIDLTKQPYTDEVNH
jgi:hypothetical protein